MSTWNFLYHELLPKKRNRRNEGDTFWVSARLLIKENPTTLFLSNCLLNRVILEREGVYCQPFWDGEGKNHLLFWSWPKYPVLCWGCGNIPTVCYDKNVDHFRGGAGQIESPTIFFSLPKHTWETDQTVSPSFKKYPKANFFPRKINQGLNFKLVPQRYEKRSSGGLLSPAYEVWGEAMFSLASDILFRRGGGGCLPSHRPPPPQKVDRTRILLRDMVNKRAVRILLECILVVRSFFRSKGRYNLSNHIVCNRNYFMAIVYAQ